MVLPEIRLLQAAIVLAEELNFSRAAERLRIDQSTLSKRIMELEGLVGLRLFERNRQLVEPTEAGRHFVEEAGTQCSMPNAQCRAPTQPFAERTRF